MNKIVLFISASFLIAAPLASAATFEAGEYVEQKEGQLLDDAYLAGAVVDVSGDIVGDATLAGGEVTLGGVVTGDALIAGGSVDLLGIVTDDIRVAGGEVVVASETRDDLIVAGGYVRLTGDAKVGGDAVIAAGAVITNGVISGDLTVYGGEVVLGGIVNGNVDLNFTEKVTINEGATIGGNLTYSANEELEIPEDVLIGGEVIRTESPLPTIEKSDAAKIAGSFFIFKLVSLLIAALILVLLFKKLSQRFGKDGHDNFWKNVLVGFVVAVVTPILSLALLFSFVGMAAGGILFLIGTTLLILGKVYGGVLAGALLSSWFTKSVVVDWKWTVIGVIAMQMLHLIPIVGGLLCFIVTLGVFGTILMLLYNSVWKNR